MHKRIAKVVSASLMAAAMITTTVATVVPMSVSAGNCLGESTFDKKGLPWHTCETSPAKQKFSLTDEGTYRVETVHMGGEAAGGESIWDLQFRHRQLKIKQGHQYKLHWEVTSSHNGVMATQITSLDGSEKVAWKNNGGGPNEYNKVSISKGKNVFSDQFTSPITIDVAEWAFHYGGGGGQWHPDDCFPEVGVVLEFDNMELECLTCPTAYSENSCNWDPNDDFGVRSRDNSKLENNFISVNQVGYYTNLSKKATLGDNAGDGEDASKISLPTTSLSFDLLDASGTSVYTGDTVPMGMDKDSGDNVHTLDFSEYKTPGTYSLKCGDYVSFPFEIADDLYSKEGHDLLVNAMNYYYQNRSGVNIEAAYITSRDDQKSSLAHIGGHNPDNAYVQSKWVPSYKGIFDGDKGYQIDGVGGWYDAGDHGKYVVNGGISVWTLQNIYERTVAQGNTEKFADSSGTVVVPEAGNGNPDILDETRYELDWMMKMVVSSSDPYWGDKAGLVYHKLHDHKWTGLATKPYDYEATWKTTRIVKPPSLAATLNFVACAAQAARLWEDIDPAYAQTCLDAAKTSYAAYEKHFTEYTPSEASNEKSLYAAMDQAIGGGAYGDTNVKDDAYWAACELYATTGDATYYEDVKAYSDAFKVVKSLEGGENSGSFGSFNWGNTASLGSISLYLNDEKITDSEAEIIKSTIISSADAYVKEESKQGYGVPYATTKFTDPINIGKDEDGNLIEIDGYEWGSNSFVINNAIVMAYAYDETDNIDYLNGVSTAMDYLFGRNPLSFSYVTGYGDYTLERPHHRYWSNELDKEFPEAPDGILSGGPGSGMQDPYIGGLGYERGALAPQRCYVDSIEAWSVNEITINWNAPFVWVASFLQDEANVDTQGELIVTPSSVNIEVGETEKLTATVDGNTVDATFSSSDDSVATVGTDGTITGVAEGTATITVTFDDQTKTVKVKVTEGPTTPTGATDATGNTVETGDVGNPVWGDANDDKDVTIADVVMTNVQLLADPGVVVLTPQGHINANVVFDDHVDASDSALIMNYIAMVVTRDQLGPRPQE